MNSKANGLEIRGYIYIIILYIYMYKFEIELQRPNMHVFTSASETRLHDLLTKDSRLWLKIGDPQGPQIQVLQT